MLRLIVVNRRAVVLGLIGGVLAAGLFAAVAVWLRVDEQPVYCPVPEGEVTPLCPGPDGEASTTAVAVAALLGFLLAVAVVALIQNRRRCSAGWR